MVVTQPEQTMNTQEAPERAAWQAVGSGCQFADINSGPNTAPKLHSIQVRPFLHTAGQLLPFPNAGVHGTPLWYSVIVTCALHGCVSRYF